MSNNPYQAPSADIAETQRTSYQPKIFTSQGRIGRLRMLAYTLAAYLFLLPFFVVAAVMGAAGADIENNSAASIIFFTVVGVCYLASFVFYFMLAKRRFNDMDKSGWFCILILIPLVNLFIILWLIFGRGTRGENRFGPEPVANPLSVKILGIIVPVAFAGSVVAVAMPAYSDYVERAQQAESLRLP